MKIARKIFPLVLTLALTMGACMKLDEVNNPLEGFKLIIDYDIFNTFISFRFVDSSSGELIGTHDQSSVTITIKGSHKDGIVNQLGEHLEGYSSFSGLLTLALNPKDPYVPSTENPVQFIVASNYDGYYENETEITITEEGKYNFDIYLEKETLVGENRSYLRPIQVGSDGAVTDSLTIFSKKEGELFSLPHGLVLLDSVNQNFKNETLYLRVTVFGDFSQASVPQNLIAPVKTSLVEQKAFNLASLALIEMWVPDRQVKKVSGGSMQLSMFINPEMKNPYTEDGFNGGDELPTWLWQPSEGCWQLADSTQLFDGGQGTLYFNTGVSGLGYFGAAVAQQLCHCSGNAVFTLNEDFLKKPVSPTLSCYRKFDGKLLGQLPFFLNNTGESKLFDFLVPENNPIELRLVNRDRTNSFLAAPSQIEILNGCQAGQQLGFYLEPVSMHYSGAFVFNFTEDFPEEEFMANIQFYDLNTGKLLITLKKLISDGASIPVSTSMQQAASLGITFSAVDVSNAFKATPAGIVVNDPQAEGQIYELALSPDNCVLSGQINFSFLGQFEDGELDFKVEARDISTNEIVETLFFKCSENQPIVPFELILPKNMEVYLKLQRVSDGMRFHATPYQYEVGPVCQKGITWDVGISPVELLTVAIDIRAVCPDAEIIPTLVGYYRLVWDDQWTEVDLVSGSTTLELEVNGVYEMGILVDDELVFEEYTITGNELNLEFDLDQGQCDKFGY